MKFKNNIIILSDAQLGVKKAHLKFDFILNNRHSHRITDLSFIESP